MADYHTPTVVQQTIPNANMTPLERLLLTNMFDADESVGEHYFYAEESPQTMLALGRDELDAAIAASQEHPSSVLPAIQEQLSRCEPDQNTIYLDLSGVSWETILQDVVRRSNTLKFISVISSLPAPRCGRTRLGEWWSSLPQQTFAGNQRRISSKSCSRKKKPVSSPRSGAGRTPRPMSNIASSPAPWLTDMVRWWCYRLSKTFERLQRAVQYGTGRLSADTARHIMLDCRIDAGWHPLLILTSKKPSPRLGNSLPIIPLSLT